MSSTEEKLEKVLKEIEKQSESLTVHGYASFLDSLAYEIRVRRSAAQHDIDTKAKAKS